MGATFKKKKYTGFRLMFCMGVCAQVKKERDDLMLAVAAAEAESDGAKQV